MSADRAEFPALEPVDIGKCPATRAPDYEVHGSLVLSSVRLKIYRQLLSGTQGSSLPAFWITGIAMIPEGI
jgi:TolB-like protein